MCLHYMMDIEAHTSSTCSPPAPPAIRRSPRLDRVGNGLGIVPTMLGSALARDFVAIHMMWGAVNELTTLTGYYALIRRSDHPVLHQLLRKVIQDERRHFAFYRAQAKARMERSRAARRMVRWALKALWTPVGAGVKSEEEVDLDAAERRVRERPGWAGVTPMPAARRDNGHPPAPTHWAESKDGRPDVMSATSDVERREEERAAHVMRIGS